MRESGKMDQTIMHCIFVGPPGVGKSTLLKRLLRMKLDQTRSSTVLAEKSVRVDIVRDVSTHVAQVSGFDWQIIEDPTTQASGLIRQITKQPEKEKRHSTEDTNRQFPGQVEQVFEQHDSFSTLSAEEQDDSAITTSPTEAPNSSQTTKSSAEVPFNKQIINLPVDEQTASQTTVSETLQLNKSINFFRHVLKEKGVSRLHVDNPCTLYLTDSGGQPEFQELLPALVVGPSVFFIVFPLHKDLNSKYEVQYERPEEDKHMQTYVSSSTIKEDLMRSISSIACTKYKDIYGNEVEPRVMFVATFKDKVPQKEVCQRRLRELQGLVKETDAYRKGMVVDASETQMVFTIDNASDNEAEKDAQKIHDAFEKLAVYFKVCTPSPWLIFSILVQHVYGKDSGIQHEHEKHSVISYDECFALAQQCGICSETEFQAALQFLHKQTGILYYYKELPELSQVVIRDPQHLFGRVNQLVEKTFIFERTHSSKLSEDFIKGIFKRTDYNSLTEEYSSSKLTPSMLLKLLEHLKVVVPLEDGQKYFMPCAIPHLDEDSHSMQIATIDEARFSYPTQSPNIPPLLITFKSGYCPKGLFGALVVCITNKQVANCTLNLDESRIHRDQIYFTLGLHSVLLRINPTYIYLEVIPPTDSSLPTDLCKLCNSVRKFVEYNITEACKNLSYSKSAGYGLSFICHCSEEDIHHPAELKHDPVNGQWFLCTRSKKEALVDPYCHIWLPEVRRKLA